jgi:hypothetical protein
VVKDDPLDADLPLRQALRGAFIRAIDLEVVFALSLAFETMPEGLAVTLVPVAVMFE